MIVLIVLFSHVAGGQTSEGVLANFFNSLLTKKAGSPGPGAQPTGGGGNTPGTVRKSGETILSDAFTQSFLHLYPCRLLEWI